MKGLQSLQSPSATLKPSPSSSSWGPGLQGLGVIGGVSPWVEGVNALVEGHYLLTYHLSLRAVGYYSYTVFPGSTYQVRSISGGLSYRF